MEPSTSAPCGAYAASRWLDDARQIDLLRIATELGLGRYGRIHLAPCPGCGEQQRSARDRRPGVVYFKEQRWRCGRCDAHGDAIDLVAYATTGDALSGSNGESVRAWFASRGWCSAGRGERAAPRVAPKRSVPPLWQPKPARRSAVAAVWEDCPRLLDEEVSSWLRSRAIDPSTVEDENLARGAPTGALPRFCSHFPLRGVRLVLPLFDAQGVRAGLQGRVPEGDPKSVRMRGVSCGGLVLASGAARALLEASTWPEWLEPETIEIVEGEMDFLTVLQHRPGAVVFGIPGSGAWTNEIAARIPDGAEIAVATHQDEAGDRYASIIHRTLQARCRVLRARWDP